MRLVIIGAGGFGREVLDVVEAQHPNTKIDFLGFLDDGSPDVERVALRGYSVLGPVSAMPQLDAAAAIGVGDPRVRELIDQRLLDWGVECPVLIHPAASIGSLVELGPGSVVTAGARLTTNIRFGRHTHLNLNCTVGHDVVGADYVTINPGATVSGDVTLGARVTLGTNCAIIQGLAIGDDATVGAGAAVVRDVPAGSTVVGVPAKPL